jgi:hypothetical protein
MAGNPKRVCVFRRFDLKIILGVLVALFLAGGARADVVKSCDGQLTAEIGGSHRGTILIKHGAEKLGVVKIDHDIVGGLFDLKNNLLVVHGMPNKINQKSPQAEFLSIYRLKPRPRMVMERTYGGGIYEIAVSADDSSIFVASRYGFDIINLRSGKIESSDPLSEPKFLKQQCESH